MGFWVFVVVVGVAGSLMLIRWFDRSVERMCQGTNADPAEVKRILTSGLVR